MFRRRDRGSSGEGEKDLAAAAARDGEVTGGGRATRDARTARKFAARDDAPLEGAADTADTGDAGDDALLDADLDADLDAGESADDLVDAPEDMDADLESQAADYMAGNDLWLYGPNARDVLDVLDRLEDVGPEDGGAIAAAWVALPKSDREAARKGARKIVEQELELGRQVRMAREEVGAWLAVAAEYPEFVKAVPDWARICSQVGESALDAVTAIILEDELEEPHYQDLISPWTDAIAELQVEEDLEEIEGVVEDEEAEPDEEEAEGEFGPNSDGVVDFLNRLWLLSPEQITRLVSGWENAPAEDLEAAHESLHAITDEDEVARDQVQRAQERITPWLNGGRLTETAGFMGQTGQSTSRRMAGPTLADACAALVVGDLLPVEDAEALYAPWFNLIGAPALPAPAPDAGDTEMDGAKS